MSSTTVLPIIVLFYPDVTLLETLIDSLVTQANNICLVDNTPIADSIKERVMSICRGRGIEAKYIGLNDNKGIAYAQNQGIIYAKDNNYSHVLLLDQDSALPNHMIRDLCEAEANLLKNGFSVAAVGPAFRDEKTGRLAPAIQQDSIFVKRIRVIENSEVAIKCDYIIASGTLIKIAVINEVGMMLDELFIDWVDIEWGERCRYHGKHVFMIPNVIMKHSIGDDHVSITGRDINLHSDFRNYFIVRNAIHLQRVSSVRWKLKVSLLFRVPLYVIFYSYHSNKPLYSFRLLSKAIYDGIVGNMGKGHFK
ncbi:glycosyltransferase family 2 protein [Aeromonas hydrophila]|uniref:glycosyltransferase family 2 protein n=1 Tax=Aeromonas hydrophila TaxID=644 RepID=UPI0009B80211|nr:glycosyltransferase family 2 protein [Aeromonas hydrophila]MBW3808974.1 glycosyltransferase family 2 protein [Aeromonas hydrophila]